MKTYGSPGLAQLTWRLRQKFSAIIDDVWAVDMQPVGKPSSALTEWMERVDKSWEEVGAPCNVAKDVSWEPNAPLQGAVIEARDHWLGVPQSSRVLLLAGTFQVLARSSTLRAAPMSPARVSCVTPWERKPRVQAAMSPVLGRHMRPSDIFLS